MTRKQRQPRAGPYTKVNGYTQRPQLQQICVVIAFLVILILHSIFIVPSIVNIIVHPILIFLLSLHYVFILIIGYDYIYLTAVDPVDSLVSGQADPMHQRPQQTKKCIICNSCVFLKSYHCMRCNRCTQNFDHHCKYLNNCIGGKNYENFFRILVVLTMYFLNVVAQALWVFIRSFMSDQLNNYMISKWPVLIVGVFVLLLVMAVDSLLVYHIYLNLVRHMTTVEYIFRQTPSNHTSSQTHTTSGNQQTENRMNQDQNI